MMITIFIFVVLLGACVGSFLNVVIYRLPAGESIVHPPSHCPRCQKGLAWYDNIPVLAWLWLGGKCRYCKLPISVQYPIIEALTALLFGGVFWWLMLGPWPPNEFWQIVVAEQPVATWPMLAVWLTLVAVLIASTMIDARQFIIPITLPWFAGIVAAVLLPIAAAWYPQLIGLHSGRLVLSPQAIDLFALLGLGAGLGLILANLLVWLKVLPRSFPEHEYILMPAEEGPAADRDATDSPPREESKPVVGAVNAAGQVMDEGWLVHPRPRSEAAKELLFVALPIIGALLCYAYWPTVVVQINQGAGLYEIHQMDAPQSILNPLRMLGLVLFGGIVGGGLVWLTRIFGTLGFGKEAMGLGDVHLMFGVGCCIGALNVIIAFFIAPFLGLAYTLILTGASKMLHREVRQVPYGPHLAAASIVMMFLGAERVLILLGV